MGIFGFMLKSFGLMFRSSHVTLTPAWPQSRRVNGCGSNPDWALLTVVPVGGWKVCLPWESVVSSDLAFLFSAVPAL